MRTSKLELALHVNFRVLKENMMRMMRRKREKRHIHQRGRRKARAEIEIRAEIEMTAEIEITAKIEIEKGIETERTETEETDTETEETETEIGIETEEIKRVSKFCKMLWDPEFKNYFFKMSINDFLVKGDLSSFSGLSVV